MVTTEISNGDPWVKEVQEWYNEEYKDRTGFVEITVDGIVGPGTCKALVWALQMELNLASPDGIFGNQTIAAYEQVGINENSTKNLIFILQGGFICKGIDCQGFDGQYGTHLRMAIEVFRSYTGMNGEAVMDARHMKALLNTDPFVLSRDGKKYVLDIQRYLNLNYSDFYWKSLGLIPCNGIPERNMVKAIVYALQYEEAKAAATGAAINTSGVDGIVGTNTLNNAPVLALVSDKTAFVKILQMALACMHTADVGLDGVFDSDVEKAVISFQKFMCLNQDSSVKLGIVDRKTWASLLISKGDTSRYANACDCATILDESKASILKEQGYDYVGRYLTGTYRVSSTETASKALTPEEIQAISKAGLNIFAIYQAGGASADYFSQEKGYSDAQKAYTAAKNLRIPLDEVIYFAVDYDFMDKQVTNIVIPHFQGINNYFAENGIRYRIGIYGSRNVCTRVSEAGLAVSSFVADMSTGYSGNMGYPMPDNWAFDQILEYTLVYSGGNFNVDKDVASGRYTGFNKNTLCGGANYRDATKHDMVLQEDGYYQCSVCGYKVLAPELQDEQILSKDDFCFLKGLTMALSIALGVEQYKTLFACGLWMMIHEIRTKEAYRNKYEYCDSNGDCVNLSLGIVYDGIPFEDYTKRMVRIDESNVNQYSRVWSIGIEFVYGLIVEQTFLKDYTFIMDIIEELEAENVEISLYIIAQRILEELGAEDFSTLLSLIQFGVEITEEIENPTVEIGDYYISANLTNVFYWVEIILGADGKLKMIQFHRNN